MLAAAVVVKVLVCPEGTTARLPAEVPRHGAQPLLRPGMHTKEENPRVLRSFSSETQMWFETLEMRAKRKSENFLNANLSIIGDFLKTFLIKRGGNMWTDTFNYLYIGLNCEYLFIGEIPRNRDMIDMKL